jgi:tetratricopeptide (TPR) repeat protein
MQRSPLFLVEATKLFSQGRFQAAKSTVEKGLEAGAADANAFNLLGVIEGQLGRFDLAVQYLRRAVQLQPGNSDAHFNLGYALQQTHDVAGAEAHYQQAVRLKPTTATYHNNLGSLYQARGDIAQAILSFKRAVECDPSRENAVANLCGAARIAGDLATLDSATALAVKAWPQNALYRIMRAEALFGAGRFGEAWDFYEWRFKAPDRPAQSRALPHIRPWNGEDLSRRSVLVWTEQSPGDEILFGTFLPDLLQRIGRVTLRSSTRMRPLFARSFPNIAVVDDKPPSDVIAATDVQASIVALAKLVRTTWSDFQTQPPYLKADAHKVREFRERYKANSTALLVGIAWRSVQVSQAAEKSVNLGAWGALFSLPNVKFVNLQYGDCTKDIAGIKAAYGVDVINDPSVDPLSDLDTYAAQVAAMDVVVSSSNTAAHVAGALGIAAHCMVPSAFGQGRRWYWLEREGHSIWYPTTRLHAQRIPGSWVDVLRDITLSIAETLVAQGAEKEVANTVMRLAAAYREAQDHNGAEAALKFVATIPGYAAISYGELGRFAKEDGAIEKALHYLDLALAADPNHGGVLNLMGLVLASQGRFAEAEPFYRRAIAVLPDGHEAYNNLGTALRRLGRGREADTLYKRAHLLKPDHTGILLNLTTNLTELGEPQAALPYFGKLLRLSPDYAEAHHSYAFALLSLGRFKEGWPELWWRHRVKENGDRPSETLLPRWAGQPLKDKSVLVWTEHGLGDEILTVSILASEMAQFGRVTLACSPRLIPIFERALPAIRVINISQVKSLDLRAFDYQISFSELGAAFRTSLQAFSTQAAFLKPDEIQRTALAAKYREVGAAQALVVGLSWASAHGELAHLKGTSLKQLVAALPANRDCVTAVSLQYGTHTPEINDVREQTGWRIIEDEAVDAILDFDAFVAQVAATDVVITISNTTAHVAGALGIPTCLLLPHARGRHWYWLRGTMQSPWYPSVHYFEQESDGTWDLALARCRRFLENLHAKRLA